MRPILENWNKFIEEAAGEKDACYHKVKSRYTKWPSAYASGALTKCRKVGADNWGKSTTKEALGEAVDEEEVEDELIDTLEDEGGAAGLEPLEKTADDLDLPKDFNIEDFLDDIPNVEKHDHGDYIEMDGLKEEDEGLHKWFSRNKGKGWVDCKTGKPCGRQKGEKRKGYPACRPTMAQCTEKGKRAKKGPGRVSWKTKKEGINKKLTEELIDQIISEELENVYYEYLAEGETLEEAEYQGRKVTLNKPTKGDVKKSKVYVKNAKGNVVKVNFGDKKMRIKKSNPKRRKSFRARHNCKNPGPKWKARYWSCKAW